MPRPPGSRRRSLLILALILTTLIASQPSLVTAAGTASAIALTPDRPSGQPVGTTITWTAGADPALVYRFSVGRVGGATQITRDFDASASFRWTPLDEGTYQIAVAARSAGQNAPIVASATATFVISSRVTSGVPVVTATAHPLVALYSLPPCGGGTVQVIFGHAGAAQDTQRTQPANCSPLASTNFYLVGMLPQTSYAIQAIYTNGAAIRYGPIDHWTSGSLPGEMDFPEVSDPLTANAATSTNDGIIWRATVGTGGTDFRSQLYATNLTGQVLWYMPESTYIQAGAARPLPGGNLLAVINDGPEAFVRISDPVGNPLRETSLSRINEQLAALPSTPGHTVEPIRAFHHEVNLLPNGHIVVLGATERLFPPGTQGKKGDLPVDIVGDAIIDLDQNLQVAWTWNAFDHLDIARGAILDEPCTGAGCAIPLQFADQAGGVAQDWLHSNAISYSPNDHNLLLSIRHQDWIVKIDYRDAQGTGGIVWKLGQDGDFALTNPPTGDPFPWFSHQHGIEMLTDGRLITFDNGNTRCERDKEACYSRGQVYQLDEQNRRATLVFNTSMDNYSAALGWAQRLQNGNYSFTSGFQQQAPPPLGEVQEFDPAGNPVYTLRAQPELLYRGYRLTTLSDGCCAPLVVIPPLPSPYNFLDLSPADPAYGAIVELAQRGIIRGYGDGRVGPGDPIIREQAAALLARTSGLSGETPGADSPTDDVVEIQAISLITRSFVARRLWQQQPDEPARYPAIPASSGYRSDLATYLHYVGTPPNLTAGEAWAAWDQSATRGWFAQALVAALATVPGK